MKVSLTGLIIGLALVGSGCSSDNSGGPSGSTDAGSGGHSSSGGAGGGGAGGSSAGGSASGGSSAGGSASGGSSAGGSSAGGSASGGAGAGGSGTAGDSGAGGSGTAGDSGAGGSGTAGDSGAGGSGTAGDSGAGGAASTSAPAVSGTRLKAKFVSTTDGARQYKRRVLFDSLLSVDCGFKVAADGKLRCLPESVNAIVLFSDDKCSKRYAILQAPPSGCPADYPKYVFTEELDSTNACSDAVAVDHIYGVEGTVLQNPQKYRLFKGNCELLNASYQGVAVTLDTETPASAFVEGSRAVAP